MRVLLAEDDDLLGSGLRAGLRQQGFQVDWVRDGHAAACEPVSYTHLDVYKRQLDSWMHTKPVSGW